MGFLLLIVAVSMSFVLIMSVGEKNNKKNEPVELQPEAVTFTGSNSESEVPSDVYDRLKEAGLVDFAGFQTKTQD